MKKKPIHAVIGEVLVAAGRALTSREIYEAIVRDELYSFQSKDPLNIVRNQLRRHSVNVEGKATSQTKHFRLTEDGRFELLQAGSPEQP